MKYIKNSKGFTLIELMAVIIILAVIGLIIFPSAIDSVNNSKEKLYREQVERILTATDSWAATHDSDLPDGNEVIGISIETLKRAGLLKNEDVINPLNNDETMPEQIVIYFDEAYNQYTSVYCDRTNGNKYYTKEADYDNMFEKCFESTIKQVDN